MLSYCLFTHGESQPLLSIRINWFCFVWCKRNLWCKDLLSLGKSNKPFYLQHNVLSLQASYKPLLKQVVEEIFNPERPDPVDIEHMSSGLTDLLKTGFSMFMKVK